MTRRLRGEDGANAVEFALVLPILVVLIFGGIWGGIAINHDLALSTAAREGARFAATLSDPAPPDAAWFSRVLQRVEDESNGSLGSVPSGYICVAYIDESDTETAWARTYPGGDASVSSCGHSDNLSGDPRVHVLTRRDSDIQAVLVEVPVTVHSEAVAGYEEVG